MRRSGRVVVDAYRLLQLSHGSLESHGGQVDGDVRLDHLGQPAGAIGTLG